MSSKSVISISGPSGTGKTTLSGFFGNIDKVSVVKEPISDELLKNFSNSPKRYAYSLQEHIITQRFESFNAIKNNSDTRVIVFDRTLTEDREVFFKLHNSIGWLSNNEIINLKKIIDRYISKIEKYDKFRIGLTAPTNILMERLQKDKFHIRPEWLLQSLPRQNELYNNWYVKTEFEKIIDTSIFDIDNLESVSKSLIEPFLK